MPANAESLDGAAPSNYRVQGNELRVVLHERKGRDDVVVIAIQQRALKRLELRALVHHLLGDAKTPTMDVYASQEAYAACVREQYRVIRDGAEPADGMECGRGTVLRMDSAEPRVLYWGSAAPASD